MTINVDALAELVRQIGKASKRQGPAAEIARVRVRHALADLPHMADTARCAVEALEGPDPEAAAMFMTMAVERIAGMAAALTRIEVTP